MTFLLSLIKKFSFSILVSKIKANKTATAAILATIFLSIILGYGYYHHKGLHKKVEAQWIEIITLEKALAERDQAIAIQNAKIKELQNRTILLKKKRDLAIKEKEQIEFDKERLLEELEKIPVPKSCDGAMGFLKEWANKD